MHLPTCVCSLVLAAGVLASGETAAQISNAPAAPQTLSPGAMAQVADSGDRAAKTKEINERRSKHYAECMQLWDPETHMTKQEWARTCRRVRDERTKFLLDQLK